MLLKLKILMFLQLKTRLSSSLVFSCKNISIFSNKKEWSTDTLNNMDESLILLKEVRPKNTYSMT